MFKRTLYILVVAAGIYLIISLGGNIAHLKQKEKEVSLAQNELEKLEKENKDLKSQLQYTKTQEFLEKEAREKLGLVLPGEHQVIIVPSSPSSQTAENKRGGFGLENLIKWWTLFF